MKPLHYCKFCNYTTDRLSSHEKHLTTRKHQKQVANSNFKLEEIGIDLEEKSKKEIAKSIDKDINCKYCNKKILHKKNLNNHYKVCKRKEKYTNNDIIIKLKEQVKYQQDIVKNKDEALRNKDTALAEIQHDYNDFIKYIRENGTLNKIIINNNNDNCTVNQLFVMNNFTEAYNIEDLMSAPLSVEETAIIKKDGAMLGCYNIIRYRCIDNIEIHKRPIHCTDKSRKKIIMRENDEWSVDFEGKRTLQKTYPLIRDLYPTTLDLPTDELIYNTKQLTGMESNESKIIDYMIDDIYLKNNKSQINLIN
jgi:hypothetical protein